MLAGAALAAEPSASVRAQRPGHLTPAVDAAAEHNRALGWPTRTPWPMGWLDSSRGCVPAVGIANMATFALRWRRNRAP